MPRFCCASSRRASAFSTTACGNSKASQSWPPRRPCRSKCRPRRPKSRRHHRIRRYLKSRDSAVVMPQVEGIITQIFVHSGEHVADGAPMMQIDPAKQQATVKSQEHARAAQVAQLKWAQQNYERVSGLANAGVVSKQDLDQARATLDAAQAQLQSLDAQVNEQQVQLHYYRWSPRARELSAMFLCASAIASSPPPHSLPSIVPAASKLTFMFPSRNLRQLKMNLPGPDRRRRGKFAGHRAASPSFRRKWIPRRKPCSPKRRSQTRTTVCVQRNSFAPE